MQSGAVRSHAREGGGCRESHHIGQQRAASRGAIPTEGAPRLPRVRAAGDGGERGAAMTEHIADRLITLVEHNLEMVAVLGFLLALIFLSRRGE